MEKLIEAIRSALRDDADPTTRGAGAMACRQILAVLEAATVCEPAAASGPPPQSAPAPGAAASSTPAPASVPASAASAAPAPAIDPAALGTLFASLGKLPPEQLLDLAIARLRAALPPGTSVPAPTPLRFQLIPLHHLGTPK